MNTERILRQCGLSVRHRGFRALQECVKLALEDESKLLSVTKLYQEVSTTSHLHYRNVERNIRTALDYAWKYGGQEQMEHLFGCELSTKPTAGEMIELLVNHIQTSREDCDVL